MHKQTTRLLIAPTATGATKKNLCPTVRLWRQDGSSFRVVCPKISISRLSDVEGGVYETFGQIIM